MVDENLLRALGDRDLYIDEDEDREMKGNFRFQGVSKLAGKKCTASRGKGLSNKRKTVKREREEEEE